MKTMKMLKKTLMRLFLFKINNNNNSLMDLQSIKFIHKKDKLRNILKQMLKQRKNLITVELKRNQNTMKKMRKRKFKLKAFSKLSKSSKKSSQQRRRTMTTKMIMKKNQIKIPKIILQQHMRKYREQNRNTNAPSKMLLFI